MTRATLLSLVLTFAVQPLCADDWPQWRGPLRTGHVPDGVAVPEKLPAAPKVLWNIPVTFGLASPVVSGGKVFYVDTKESKETVHAVDAITGKEIWAAEFDDEVPKDSQSLPGPRCTPLVDGDRVYIQTSRGALHCRSTEDGKQLWATSYVRDFAAVFTGEKGQAQGATRHGYTGQPVIDGDHLIAEVGGQPDAGVVCFDKKTRKVIWKSTSDTPAYAPPIVATVAGVRQVIAFTVEGVIGLGTDDGKLLWRVPLKTTFGRHVTTPVVVDDIVVVASHQLGLIGIQVARDGNALKATRIYTVKDLAINFSSPVTVGDYLYGPGPLKNLICVNVRTGKQAWSREGYFNGNAGKVHAGMLVMGKNILALTDSGQLVLFAADPQKFTEIGHVQACAANWCIPAYADGKLYLRDAKELWCIQIMP